MNFNINFPKQASAPAGNRSVTFTFPFLPANLSQLQKLPECSLDTPFKAAALSVVALCSFERNSDAVFEMLDYLKGPDSVSPFEKQFIRERLSGKYYKPFSFFAGSTPENGYTPSTPFTITVQ